MQQYTSIKNPFTLEEFPIDSVDGRKLLSEYVSLLNQQGGLLETKITFTFQRKKKRQLGSTRQYRRRRT